MSITRKSLSKHELQFAKSIFLSINYASMELTNIVYNTTRGEKMLSLTNLNSGSAVQIGRFVYNDQK